jgi:hypothetical protein
LIEGPIPAQVNWERKQEEIHCPQLMRAAEWRVKTCIGFLPTLALSIHKNAQQVLGDMSPGCYLLKAGNTAFHDLTKQKSLPPAAASLLGLSLKFIPTPHHSPSWSKVEPSLATIEHDIGLKNSLRVKMMVMHPPNSEQNPAGTHHSYQGLLTFE